MNEEKHQKLMFVIQRFVDGKDRSIKAANQIEGLLEELFPEDDRFEEVVIALASYRPGGGDYLYDEKQMTNILIQTRKLINSDN